MLFYFIRHGDPDYSTDSLTPLGKRQAEAVARRLSVRGLDRIYSSPMGRARETAQPTAEILRLPIEIEDWTSEALAWEQLTEKDENGKTKWIHVRMQKPETCETERSILTMDNWADMPSMAGTGAKEGFARIQAASDEFFARQGYVREGAKFRIERPNNDRIALFAHGGFGVAFVSVLLGIPPQFILSTFEMPHCGISIFEFANHSDGYTCPRCLSYSDTSFQYQDRLPMLYNNSIKI